MTIAPFRACVNAAHVPRPMNGGIVHPSTMTFTSLRGKVTLYTPSFSFIFPLSPVILSIFAVSSAASALTPIAAEIAAKIKSFFIGEAVSSGAIERSRTVAIRLVLLAFLFLFFALLVLLQELPVCINFDAPLLAIFVYDSFVNGLTFFCLLLDLHDLVGASFVF